MNSKISKTSDPHRLLLNLTDKINLRRKDKYIALPNLTIYYHHHHPRSCLSNLPTSLCLS